MASGEIVPRRRYAPARRDTVKAIERLEDGTRIEQTAIRAISAVTEFGMSEVVYLRWRQRELEQAVPDAAEDLAIIAKTGAMAIARNVHRFGSEMS